ncbi:AraC family transcriptional regulator N-terminal domain-containing protein [uncultured Roseibium sp.]|uniref:AraC family transcriptional regulator n=1 Tax=uncultured Roseibium sp. TaxID=1936171 RepID=UPI00321665D5
MTVEELARKVLEFADIRQAGDQPMPVGVDGLSLVRQRAPSEIYPVVYQPIFCLVLQGAKETYLGNRTVRFARMESLIVGLDLPALARVVQASQREPYVALALALDMTLIRELAGETGSCAGSGPRAAEAVVTGQADEAVLDAMGRLFALHDKPDAARVLEPLIRKEIHYWLLTARHGQILRDLAEQDSHAARIARAIAVIRRSFSSPLRVEDLARAAGMSGSAFHAHFKAITGTTPLQFQKQLRLMEARRLMQAEKLSVASTAFQVGYESPTQFSREYARHFGASPRSDRAKTPVEALI